MRNGDILNRRAYFYDGPEGGRGGGSEDEALGFDDDDGGGGGDGRRSRRRRRGRSSATICETTVPRAEFCAIPRGTTRQRTLVSGQVLPRGPVRAASLLAAQNGQRQEDFFQYRFVISASMVLIEIHEINATAHQPQQASTAFPSGYDAFRLIYNGEVLTSRMDGCDSELCDSLVLVERVRAFAKPYDDAECASLSSSSSTLPSTPTPPDDGDLMTEMERATRDMLVAPGGTWAMALLVISSMVLGGVPMWFQMRQESRKYERYADRDGSVMGLSMRVMSDEDDDGRRNFRSTTARSSGIDRGGEEVVRHRRERADLNISAFPPSATPLIASTDRFFHLYN